MKSSRANSQIPLPPMQVKPLDGSGDSPIQNVDLTLAESKAQIGRALRRTIRRSESSLKEFGDPSQVNRVCDGDVPNVIARVWQKDRGGLIEALADESGLFDVRTTISERRSA